MYKPKFPSPEEIKVVIDKIETRLQEKPINMHKNFHVKEGFTDCIRILNNRLENPNNPYFMAEKDSEIELSTQIYRDQMKGIDKLKTQEGRAIAILCVDYLNGRVKAENILNIPIKKR